MGTYLATGEALSPALMEMARHALKEFQAQSDEDFLSEPKWIENLPHCDLNTSSTVLNNINYLPTSHIRIDWIYPCQEIRA